MKRKVLTVGAAALLILGGSSVAASGLLAGTGDPDETNETQENDAGILGGTIERFHRGGACDLVDVGSLDGNWTHGSYVTAVAELGDASLVPVAARSDCGEPMVAVGHGGPPANAPGLGHATGLDHAEDALGGHATGTPAGPPGGS